MEEIKRVCPKCGMPLVEDSNYCMNCCETMDLPKTPEEKEAERSNASKYVNAEAILREKIALQRRERHNRSVFARGGTSSMLLVMIGTLLGVTLGVLFLSWCFKPREKTVVLERKEPVTFFAGVEWVDPPSDEPAPLTPEDLAKQKSSDRPREGEKKEEEGYLFHCKLTIQARGDKVLSIVEENVWDISKVKPESVDHVVNALNFQAEPYQFSELVLWEVIREEDRVIVRKSYEGLENEETMQALVEEGVLDASWVEELRGKKRVSLQIMYAKLKLVGWKLEGAEEEERMLEDVGPSGQQTRKSEESGNDEEPQGAKEPAWKNLAGDESAAGE
ncbi:MAG: zinc ribbon domain-containing protein [Lachnospiraceae bacterium]|nr:zinc ribbon domain-containing protein [Lachnospiraceae bacterium]